MGLSCIQEIFIFKLLIEIFIFKNLIIKDFLDWKFVNLGNFDWVVIIWEIPNSKNKIHENLYI